MAAKLLITLFSPAFVWKWLYSLSFLGFEKDKLYIFLLSFVFSTLNLVGFQLRASSEKCEAVFGQKT